MNGAAERDQQEFLNVFLASHRVLYAYTVSITPSLTDAEEVFQETSLILWQKWQDYDSQREFLPWAFGIARIQAKNHLSKSGRQGELLGDDVAMIVAKSFEKSSQTLDTRLDALQKCFGKLSAKQQKLMKRCYSENAGTPLQVIAAEMKVTANSLYLQLKRLRELLHICIDNALLMERRT